VSMGVFFGTPCHKTSDIATRLEDLRKQLGGIPVSGRYHCYPRTVEEDYVICSKVVGSGISGDVKLATGKSNTSESFAVKSFKISKLNSSELKCLQNEIDVFLRMDHPHITRLYDVYESKESLHLVMEYLQGGELFDRIKQVRRFKEQDASEAVWQILLALNYIHSHGIVHRDIKMENFLYDQPGSNQLKLIDFGFSKMCNPGTEMQSSLGTVAYVAPEVLLQSYTSQCDLWSLGVISFVLLSGQMPFPSSPGGQQMRNILDGRYSITRDRWRGISAEGLHFVRSLLQVDPAKRLTAQAALDHPWIERRHPTAQIDQDCVLALQKYRHCSRFRRCCMEVLAWSLSSADCEQVCKQFISMDENRHGSITIDELKKAMCSLGVCDDEDEVKRVFDALDLCHDQEIHYTEFLAAMVGSKININEDVIKSAFKHFDVDGSGYITADNLRKLLGDTVEGARVESLMGEAEHSERDRISYTEFRDFVNRKPEVPEGRNSIPPSANSSPLLENRKRFSITSCDSKVMGVRRESCSRRNLLREIPGMICGS